jgi:hypothetical protein
LRSTQEPYKLRSRETEVFEALFGRELSRCR